MENFSSGALVLADGSVFKGISVGIHGYACGEVVFNTAQTGYQETMTDPSYTRQIIVFTQPHIGNVGINALDMESDRVYAKGVIMRSYSKTASNWRAEGALNDFLKKEKVIALAEIDTRALTHHLRKYGSQSGCIVAGNVDLPKALELAQSCPSLIDCDLAKEVTTDKPYIWSGVKSFDYHIVLFDYGVKRSIIRNLAERDCKITIVPAITTIDQVLELKPDGIVLSNGPGDPAACTYTIKVIQKILEKKIPIMAICLGHQLLALASGAATEKMIFGHHGSNHPILDLKSKKVAISSQNHGFVVSEEGLPSCLRVTHRSLFDGTIAGIERTDTKAFGFQGHPEAGPGPTELTSLFDHFIKLLEEDNAEEN